MCNKVVNTCLFTSDSVSDQYKTQEICDKVVFKYPFMLEYCFYRYKNQEIFDRAINSFLPTLKLRPDLCQTYDLV